MVHIEALTTEALEKAPIALPVPARRSRRKYSQEQLKKKLNRLQFAAIDCLSEILSDGGAKAADRISAAKLAFDAADRRSASGCETPGVMRVVIEGMPEEFAE